MRSVDVDRIAAGACGWVRLLGTPMLVFATVVMPAFAPAQPPVIEPVEPWSNVFGGKEMAIHLRVRGQQATRARLLWRFAMGDATLARGERAVDVQVRKPAQVELKLDVPEVKDDIILACTLTVALQAEGADEPVATMARTMYVFPTSPFVGKQDWLKSLDIRLFDPEKRTARVFEDAGIPFKTVANADSIANLKEGLLVVGEGASFRDYRGLARLLQESADGGRNILMLAPGGGDFPLPAPRRLDLRGEDVIHALDKRLDDASWPWDGKVRRSAVRLVGDRGSVNVEVTEGQGWPWVEMEHAAGGRLVICGFDAIRKWDSTPAPRFFLARVLEYVTRSDEK